MKSHHVVFLDKLRLHKKFKRLKITHNFKIIIYNPNQLRYQQISHFLCVSERRDCLPQGLKQKPVGFCCHFTVFSMWNIKISQADGEREGKKPKTNARKLTMFLGFFQYKSHSEIKTGVLGFGCGVILTMQLPNPTAALIKAIGTSSPVYPTASNHPQYNNFSLSDPTPFSPATHSPDTEISPT